jgi:hypothetical protein
MIFGPWINVMHYVKTPWTWARFQARSNLMPGSSGFNITVNFENDLHATSSNASLAGSR